MSPWHAEARRAGVATQPGDGEAVRTSETVHGGETPGIGSARSPAVAPCGAPLSLTVCLQAAGFHCRSKAFMRRPFGACFVALDHGRAGRAVQIIVLNYGEHNVSL